jgi:hypothetical protein
MARARARARATVWVPAVAEAFDGRGITWLGYG